jgi:hypothetical protein
MSLKGLLFSSNKKDTVPGDVKMFCLQPLGERKFILLADKRNLNYITVFVAYNSKNV